MYCFKDLCYICIEFPEETEKTANDVSREVNKPPPNGAMAGEYLELKLDTIMRLLDTLTKFNGGSCVEELDEKFSKIASAFLYGGYIDVNNVYKVYIKTVEFYFHSETDNGVHDPIVYHRNKNEQKIPYFPLMTLHAHNSGFDITFESEAGEYRASALIRSYEVKKGDKYLKWNKNHFEENDECCFNTQSTYLYFLLNGFPLGESNGIKWVDVPYTPIKCEGRPRKNVSALEGETEFRKWSFTRKDKNNA